MIKKRCTTGCHQLCRNMWKWEGKLSQKEMSPEIKETEKKKAKHDKSRNDRHTQRLTDLFRRDIFAFDFILSQSHITERYGWIVHPTYQEGRNRGSSITRSTLSIPLLAFLRWLGIKGKGFVTLFVRSTFSINKYGMHLISAILPYSTLLSFLWS